MKWSELPRVFPDMPLWGAKAGPFSFVISLDRGEYRASWKDQTKDLTPFGHQPANPIGDAFKTWMEAEKACKAQLKKLVQ